MAHRCLKRFRLVPNRSDKLMIAFGIRLSRFESIAKLFQAVQLSAQIGNIQFGHIDIVLDGLS